MPAFDITYIYFRSIAQVVLVTVEECRCFIKWFMGSSLVKFVC